jgi:hypothetical protein
MWRGPPVAIDSLDQLPATRRLATINPVRKTPSTMNDGAVRRELDRYLAAIGAYLPVWLCRSVIWLRKPSRIIVRVAVALLLIAGGFLSFLPVLGVWMLPLGLIIISQDLPFLQRPLLRTFQWAEEKWQGWRRHA